MLLVERTPRTATIKLSWYTMLQRPGSKVNWEHVEQHAAISLVLQSVVDIL